MVNSKERFDNNKQIKSTMYLVPKRTQATPSTISTKATSTTVFSTPDINTYCDENSLPFEEGETTRSENFIGSQKKKKERDVNDILAQWRRERQDHQKLKRIENIQNRVAGASWKDEEKSDKKAKKHISGGVSKVGASTSTTFHDESCSKGNNVNGRVQVSRNFHKSKVIDDRQVVQSLPQTPAGDLASFAESTEDEGRDSSIVTTPTGNTTLNSIGMERICNRASTSSGVRLFSSLHHGSRRGKNQDNFVVRNRRVVEHQNNKYRDEELKFQSVNGDAFHGEGDDSVDVSLITQDTDMMFWEGTTKKELHNTTSSTPTQTIDDKKTLTSKGNHNHEEISLKNASRIDHNSIDSNKIPYPKNEIVFANQNDIIKALSSLQSSLDETRIIRTQQDDDLMKKKDIIKRLDQEKELICKNNNDFRRVLCTTINEMLEQVNDLQDLCSDQDGESALKLKGVEGCNDVQALQEISNVMNQLALYKIPKILNQLRKNTDSVRTGKAELARIDKQVLKAQEDWEEKVRQQEEIWTFKQQNMNKQLEQVERKLITGSKELKMVQEELSQSVEISQSLQDSENKIEKNKEILSNVTIETSRKREELFEIERLCEEHIQSAHSIENDAQVSAKEASKEKRMATRLHEAAVEKIDAAKSIDKAVELKREELESDRLAWEAQLSLKHDQLVTDLQCLEGERQKVKEVEDSLIAQKNDLAKENERVKSVQNQLLEVEALTEEKLLISNEKEANIKKREDDIICAEKEVSERKMELNSRLTEVDEKSKELSTIEIDLKRQMLASQQDQDEVHEEKQRFSDQLIVLERRETDLQVDRDELTMKTSKLSKAIKCAKDDAEKGRQKLERWDCQLREKEKTIGHRFRTVSSKEKEFAQELKEFEMKQKQIAQDQLSFQCSLKNEKAEHNNFLQIAVSNRFEEERRLKDLAQKRKEEEKSYKKLCSEVAKVKESIKKKINVAQSELQVAEKDVKMKKIELGDVQEKIKNISKDLDGSRKERKEILEGIRVEEVLLLKIKGQIKSEKDEWNLLRHEKENELGTSLKLARQEAENKLSVMQEQAMSKMMKISNDLAFRQEEASCKLSSRARQVDLLHSKLSKVVKRTQLDRKQLQEEHNNREEEIMHLKKELQQNLESIQLKDSELHSHIKANKGLKASIDSSTLHETILSKSLQSKDKELNALVHGKSLLEQNIVELKCKLSTQNSFTSKLKKDYEEKLLKVKEETERDLEISRTQHEKSLNSLEEISNRTNKLMEKEQILEREKDNFMKRMDTFEKTEECITNQILEINQKELQLKSRDEKLVHSKFLLQEEREKLVTKTNALRQKEDEMHEQTAKLSARQEIYQKERNEESLKVQECRLSINQKTIQLDEKETLLEQRALELEEWKSKLADSSMKANREAVITQTNLNEREKGNKITRSELVKKLRSVQDREENLKTREASIKTHEEMIGLESKKVSERLSIKERNISLAHKSLKDEKEKLSVRLKEIEFKEEEVDHRNEEIKNQHTNNMETEQRLKEVAHNLKKQEKDIKAKEKDIKTKEKNIQNIARLLKERQIKSTSKELSQIKELQNSINIKQKQYEELLEEHKKQGAKFSAQEKELNQLEKEASNTDSSDESQQRIVELAIKLKQKDEELTIREKALEDRVLKCDECEATLSAWNMKLDGMAVAMDVTLENQAFQIQNP